MIVLANIPQTTYPPVKFASPGVQLPQGTSSIRITYTTPGWPMTNDGMVDLSIEISDNNGTDWRVEWRDVFQHKILTKTPASQSVQIGLSKPFGATSRCRFSIESDVSITTAVTIEAN